MLKKKPLLIFTSILLVSLISCQPDLGAISSNSSSNSSPTISQSSQSSDTGVSSSKESSKSISKFWNDLNPSILRYVIILYRFIFYTRITLCRPGSEYRHNSLFAMQIFFERKSGICRFYDELPIIAQ